MSEAFNPYLAWLAIPASEQPPNHYRLLGLRLFESDPLAIRAAAEGAEVRLRTRHAGEHEPQKKRLLFEIEAARRCLSNSSQKAAYDWRLRGQGAGTSSVAERVASGLPLPKDESAMGPPGQGTAAKKFSSEMPPAEITRSEASSPPTPKAATREASDPIGIKTPGLATAYRRSRQKSFVRTTVTFLILATLLGAVGILAYVWFG